MKRTFIAVCLVLFAVAAIGAERGAARIAAAEARVMRQADGSALTPPSRAPHAEIAASFLQSQGLSPRAIRGMVEVSVNRVERTGVTHRQYEQKVQGLPVFGAYSRMAIDEQGRVVSAIDRLVEVPESVRPASIREGNALEAALDHLFGSDRPELHQAPVVTRMAVPMEDGTLREGFLVETWTEKKNLLHHTLISGTGEVLNVELRTSQDTYNVFADHPEVTPQTLVSGPGSGNAESPIGWLFASGQTTINISGNNVHAYLDTNASNSPDPGGSSVTSGNFTTTANLSESPSTATNKAVAVQNLFYLNNIIHDKLYRHGFVEEARNFQEDNFGKGGLGNDSVRAEAQDGSGTDNANFATPSDGSKPRMQMFLWHGIGDHLVTVGDNTYLAMGAQFGPALNTTGKTAQVAYVGGDGCSSIATITGMIALIDRGNCDFVTKVKNAQNANAIGAIVANNAGDDILTMGGSDTSITIPSVFVGQSSGAEIGAANTTTTISANPNPPLMKDGDLDSDIVYHEYGHGLTWRMIGSMSGAMSGAIGEGMSDVLAILINDRDTVGSYSASNSRGIRRYPYTNYPLTYGDFAGQSVHNDGEIYAAAVWKVWQIFQANGVSKDTLFDYLIDGMNYTPAGPTMEQMRDGILTSAAGSGHECLIWEGFAALGIGEGASVRVRGPNYTVTESFAMPSSCSGGTSNVAPTASFSFTTNELTASFTDASTDSDGTIVSRSWNFGDGGTSTATNPSHTYAAAGTYTVSLTVTDDGGATGSTSESVTVSTAPGGDGITLSASGYKVKGVQHADLSWTGASGTVTVLRNGATIATVSGSSYTDNIGNKGGGSYSYQVCEGGTCSNIVQVNF
jgi:extracellular elastinolytic metalloproteinase